MCSEDGRILLLMPRSLTPRCPSPPSAFWPLFQATHHLLHPGARPPGFFPPTFSRRSGLFHDSHLVRLGKAAAWPRGARMLRAQGSRGDGGGGHALPRAAAARGSIQLSNRAPSILLAGRAGRYTELAGPWVLSPWGRRRVAPSHRPRLRWREPPWRWPSPPPRIPAGCS